jgi:hypothetical protein
LGDSMSTIINATTTNGVVIQPDNSGSLVLQTNSGTTALTIDTSQRAAFVAGTAAAPAITTTGDTNTGMFFPAADTIAFAEGGTEAMRLDSSGNVGIGTSSPSTKLSFGSFIPSNGQTLHIYQSGNSVSGLGVVSGVYRNFTASDAAMSFGQVSLSDGSTYTERMRIDSSGRITTPYQPAFHANCNGTTQLSGATLLFQTVATNISNSYNSSTSTFTAPVAGTYYIYGSVMANTGTGRLYWRFAKNGNFFAVSQAGGDSTNYGEWFGSMTVTLAANDSIIMYLGEGTPYGANSNEQYFGGYLLG